MKCYPDRPSFREFEKNVKKSLKSDRNMARLSALKATESVLEHLLEKAMNHDMPLTSEVKQRYINAFGFGPKYSKELGDQFDQWLQSQRDQPQGTEITFADMRDGDKVRVVLKSGVEVTYPAVKKTKAEPFMEIFRVGMDIPEKDVQAIYLLDRPVITPDPKVHPVLVVFELADQTIPPKGHAHSRQNGHGELIYEYLPEGSDQLVCMNPEIITGWKPGKVVEA